MDKNLQSAMIDYFKSQRVEYDETWKDCESEWIGNRLRMHNIETDEITEQEFPEGYTFVDFEQYKIVENLSEQLLNRMNKFQEKAERDFIWQNEVYNYLSNEPEYQALNRVYELLVYEKYDSKEVYTF